MTVVESVYSLTSPEINTQDRRRNFPAGESAELMLIIPSRIRAF